jgi:DnaJ homolog subfamily C member 28
MLSNRLARSLHTSARLLNQAKPDFRASSKLFADAARDEATEEAEIRRRSALPLPQDDAPNWTGDERVEDTVLRMLVDKYKPLRGDFRSADEKLRRAPPSVSVRPAAVEDDEETSLADLLAARISAAPSSAPVEVNAVPLSPSPLPLPEATHPGSLADVPLLPSIEGHRPWHTTFKAPSHTASVRVGHFSAPRPSSTRVPTNPQDEKALRAERAAAKRTASAVRLTSARESTLDYKLGTRKPERRGPLGSGGGGPVSMKAWTNLVEERIEAARRAGKFASLPGRHKPLERSTEEHNPFIARDEFLLNRLVQRQGAAPPWVEIQAGVPVFICDFGRFWGDTEHLTFA